MYDIIKYVSNLDGNICARRKRFDIIIHRALFYVTVVLSLLYCHCLCTQVPTYFCFILEFRRAQTICVVYTRANQIESNIYVFWSCWWGMTFLYASNYILSNTIFLVLLKKKKWVHGKRKYTTPHWKSVWVECFL